MTLLDIQKQDARLSRFARTDHGLMWLAVSAWKDPEHQQ